MQRRPRRQPRDVGRLLSDTQELVTQLVRQNRLLKVENAHLTRELERVTAGWEEIKKLARQAPRRTRRRSTR